MLHRNPPSGSFHATNQSTVAAARPVSQISRIALAMVVASLSQSADAASVRLIEVSSDTQTYTGKVISMNGSICCIQDRFGVVEQLPVSQLKGFRVAADQYRPASATEIREQLRLEFPGNYEFSGSTHYLVCAPQGRASSYCDLFEGVFRQVEHFYRVHGFQVRKPDTTLMAIVFGSQNEFRNYCQKDNVAWSPQLQGYYSLRTNRVALFDDPERSFAAVSRNVNLHLATSAPSPNLRPAAGSSLVRPLFSVSGETANTIIHETTHQVGYNIGIHSRLGGSPTWILEGLATVLEADGVRTTGSKGINKSRINESRLDWFRKQYAIRRVAGDVANMVANEGFFKRNVLDAYSNAWALTFFMTESPARTQQFVRYIRLVESRDPQATYTAEERLADFAQVFGDISRLEVDFLRTLDRL